MEKEILKNRFVILFIKEDERLMGANQKYIRVSPTCRRLSLI